jgi:hypothetical protein
MPPPSLHSCYQWCGRKSSLHFSGSGPAPGPIPYLDDDIPLLSVEEESGESQQVGQAAPGGVALAQGI